MTRKEAIKICSREKEQIQQALDVCADGGNYVSPDGMITALDYVEAMGMAIAALREQPLWISVEERLPEQFVSVLGYMTDAGDFPSVRECYLVGMAFFFPALRDVHPVSHWMPLPELPKEEV